MLSKSYRQTDSMQLSQMKYFKI